MEVISLVNKFSVARRLYEDEGHSSQNEESFVELSYSIFLKSSAETSDSLTDDSREDSTQDIEESVMNWFANKGISSGNPEDVIEKARQKQRKNKRMEVNMGSLCGKKSSSLMERRRNKSMNISL